MWPYQFDNFHHEESSLPFFQCPNSSSKGISHAIRQPITIGCLVMIQPEISCLTDVIPFVILSLMAVTCSKLQLRALTEIKASHDLARTLIYQ